MMLAWNCRTEQNISPSIHNFVFPQSEECLFNCGQCLHSKWAWYQIVLFYFKIGLVYVSSQSNYIWSSSFVGTPETIVLANESSHHTHKITLPVHELWHLLQTGWPLHLNGHDRASRPCQDDVVAPRRDNTSASHVLVGTALLEPLAKCWGTAGVGLLLRNAPFYIPRKNITPTLREHNIHLLVCLRVGKIEERCSPKAFRGELSLEWLHALHANP